VVLILRMLKKGGRSATIVPDGVLFGSSKAHQALRRLLVEDHQLDAVISLPSGVFKPYAGVSTAILVFSKGGTTDQRLLLRRRRRRLLARRQAHPLGRRGWPLRPDRQERPVRRARALPEAEAPRRTPTGRRSTSWCPRPTSSPRTTTCRSTGTRRPSTRRSRTTRRKVIIARLRALEAEIAKDLSELEKML
jgi:type I restriction enzyme M protein